MNYRKIIYAGMLFFVVTGIPHVFQDFLPLRGGRLTHGVLHEPLNSLVDLGKDWRRHKQSKETCKNNFIILHFTKKEISRIWTLTDVFWFLQKIKEKMILMSSKFIIDLYEGIWSSRSNFQWNIFLIAGIFFIHYFYQNKIIFTGVLFYLLVIIRIKFNQSKFSVSSVVSLLSDSSSVVSSF